MLCSNNARISAISINMLADVCDEGEYEISETSRVVDGEVGD